MSTPSINWSDLTEGLDISTTQEIKQFQKNVKDNGFSIIGQNKSICPADKYIYSIRDITSTIKSCVIP